jgi:hypothetical protein
MKKLKLSSQYYAIQIGLILSIVSALSTLTIILPMLSILPGALFEEIFSSILGKSSDHIGLATLIFFCSFFLIEMILVIIKVRKRAPSKFFVNVLMVANFFIVHNLGFYLWWSGQNFRGDGQLIFAIYKTYPMSSILFLVIGFLIDLTKKQETQNQ